MRRLIQAISRHHLFSIAFLLSTVALSACREDLRNITAPDRPEAMTMTIKDPTCCAVSPGWLQQYFDQFISISAGDEHTCAIKRNGTTYCWGGDWYGQAGPATGTCQYDQWDAQHIKKTTTFESCVGAPTVIAGVSASQLDAGFDHTCVLDGNGAAICWGDGGHGEVGLGNFPPAPRYKAQNPYPVTVAPVDGTTTALTFTSISAGEYSTCGTTADGIYCWGIINGWMFAPTLVYSGTGFSGATVGYMHGCAVYTGNGSREARCWGSSDLASAGWSFATLTGTPAMTTVFGNSVNRITTQGYFSCVDQASGNVQCVGDDFYGQLGDGNSGPWARTDQLKTVPGSLSGVSTSKTHACALDPSGHAFCWGHGTDGQLGDGGTADRYTPVAVNTTLTFRAITAGDQHTCAIGTDNRIYCWGSNKYGRLGNGSYYYAGAPALTPALIL